MPKIVLIRSNLNSTNNQLKRIIVPVKIENALDVSKSLRCDAFVDTDLSLMVLPVTWKDRLGSLEATGTIDLETAYEKRSAAAHGRPKHKPEDLLSTFNLLRRVLMAIIDRRKVPSKNNLEGMLFGSLSNANS